MSRGKIYELFAKKQKRRWKKESKIYSHNTELEKKIIAEKMEYIQADWCIKQNDFLSFFIYVLCNEIKKKFMLKEEQQRL